MKSPTPERLEELMCYTASPTIKEALRRWAKTIRQQIRAVLQQHAGKSLGCHCNQAYTELRKLVEEEAS